MPFVVLFQFWYVVRHAYVQAGDTALMMASKEGHTAVVKALLHAGADVNLKDEVRVWIKNLSNQNFTKEESHFAYESKVE